VKSDPGFNSHPVLAGLEKVEGGGLKNLDVRRQRSWLVSRFSGSFSFFKEPQSGPDCGSPFLLLTLLLAKQKKSKLPPGNPRQSTQRDYYQFRSCLRTYPLAHSPKTYPKKPKNRLFHSKLRHPLHPTHLLHHLHHPAALHLLHHALHLLKLVEQTVHLLHLNA
jgi:hypothetical protein